MQKLKVNDEVVILTGKDSGKTGKITKINWKTNKVYVDGINLVKKAIKPTQENPTGGFADIVQGINISNVSVVSPKTGKATRVRIENKDGKKVRVAVKCGSQLS
jgi:large subunit ribosomal protein L24